MKKTAAILLLFFVCLYTGGAYIAFHVKKAAVKNEVKAYLRAHPNVSGEFLQFETKNDQVVSAEFEWAEANEFIYRGKMYDVISVEYKKEHAIIHCIKDADEDQLIELYAQMHKKSENNSSSQNSFKFFSQLFFVQEEKTEQLFAVSKPAYIIEHLTYLSEGFAGADEKPPSRG